MMQMIIRGDVEMLVIENKDRLVRFGYEILEKMFKYFGCKILVLNDILENKSLENKSLENKSLENKSRENKSYEQELTEDLISIIHYFTMKNYSHRRKLNKLRKELETSEKISK